MFSISKEAREFSQALKQFSAATYKVKGSHSYAAGYYESVMAAMYSQLTRKARAEFLREMREAAARHDALAELVK